MKFRVIALKSGKKVKPLKGEVFLLSLEGIVFISHKSYLAKLDVGEGYIVEFAFKRKENGKWCWTEGVIVSD